jgi:transcriptional regulator with XRE-family HTH domain
MPAGRPSKIKKIDLSDVKHYASKGYTDKQLAKVFGVTEQTINNWKKDYPEFFESLKSGKFLADKKVEASLYQRACGYSHPDVDIRTIQDRVVITPIIKHYPPDTTACIYWLKNRDPEKWPDRQKVEHSATIVGVDLKEIEKKSESELITLFSKISNARYKTKPD